MVKGWKKSANWSFPRGKINKDEDDLDCAVREVYEETGFDVREAGLVKDEKEMKHIEITMREQHMRLYVFRGVPGDTHFEPQTRKEISKIEWYKLTDLPTLKKSRQQHDGSGTDQVSISANKFYMVAPFLNPLKKWITQQRKKENRYSSHLAAPPIFPEEATTEVERDTDGFGVRLAGTAPPADLPEVSVPAPVDPTSHRKEMLHIGTQPFQSQPLLQHKHMPEVDAKKSNALLALLRGSHQDHPGIVPQPPLEQISGALEAQRSPHASHHGQPELDRTQPPPPLQQVLPQSQTEPALRPSFQGSLGSGMRPDVLDYSNQPAPTFAPYQRIGDPLSVPQGAMRQHQPVVPPASALPKLTNHTKHLLDVFKGSFGVQNSSIFPNGTARQDGPSNTDRPRWAREQQQDQPGVLGLQALPTHGVGRNSAPLTPDPILHSTAQPRAGQQLPSKPFSRQDENTQGASLVQRFNQPSTPKVASTIQPPAAFELAATTAHTPPEKPKSNKDELLLALLRQGNLDAPQRSTDTKRPSPREGETSATISGPLNQPEFEVVSRTTKHVSNEMGRSPVTTNRTLYDPNAPMPVKILTRPEEPRLQSPRSPGGLKPISKRTTRDKSAPKEPAKPFQPQILRRPQTLEAPTADAHLQREEAPVQQPVSTPAAAPSSAIIDTDTIERLTPSRESSHTDTQKQKLLSLFGGGPDTTPKASAVRVSPSVVSPLTASQIMSINGEGRLTGIEPISTRTSRVGSMASVVSAAATGRLAAEKRQTGAENKAFLLGYLGRIATQEK